MARKTVWMVVVLALAGLLLLSVTTALAQERPDAPPYAQRGPYVVGTQELTLDGGEDEPALAVTVWYPALNPDDAPEETTYVSGLFSGTGRALRDAAPDPAGGPYPLLVFSHGLGGIRQQSLFFTEHLASHGFVVMAADHPGSTLAEVILGDRAAEGINRSFATRPLEVLRQIAFAEALNEAGQPLAGLIDLDRIAVAGHSFGGYTAAGVGGARLDFGALADWCDDPTGLAFDPEADPPFSPFDLPDTPEGCGFEAYADDIAAARGLTSTPDGLWPATTDPRIGAVILLAPFGAANYGPAGIASIEAPTLIVVGSLDRATVPERDAYVYYDGISSAEKALVVLENAGHYIFLEECPPLAVSFGLYNLCSDLVWDMDRAHDLVNHFTTAFLLATFTGNGEAAALAPANVDFVGVQYVAER